MLRTILMAILCAVPLAAQDFEFAPIKCTPSGWQTRPTCALVTWDKPAIEVKQLEVYIFAHNWPVMPTIDERVPDWRKRLFVEEFDAAAWAKAGGPHVERTRIAVDAARVPMGVIDQREEYRMVAVAVLFLDAEGKRSVPANMKAVVESPNHLAGGVYFMPTYFPNFTATRVFGQPSPYKVKWTLPQLGTGPYEIEKLIFLGMDKSLPSSWASRLEGGIGGWIAGKDADSKPMVQDLPADATSAWIKNHNFQYLLVLAVTRGGLHFTCKLDVFGGRYFAAVSEEEQKTLPAIDLKPAQPAKAPEPAPQPENEPEKQPEKAPEPPAPDPNE